MRFLNFSLDKKLPKKLLLKHFSYVLFWIFGLGIFVFRIDTIIYSSLNLTSLKIGFVAPVIYLFFLFLWIKNQKWYYTLAFFFYPFLLIFWFIPKWILFYGKIYIFFYYLNFILKIIRNYKKTIFISLIAIVLSILLATGNSLWLRGFSILFFSYIYILFFKNFLKEIFKPSDNFKSFSELQKFDKPPSRENFSVPTFIKNLEERKEDEKLSEVEKELRIRQRLINTNLLYDYVIQSLSGFRNERSYIIFCIFQLFLYFIITIFYFSFINFQLFHISNQLFLFSSTPSVFDFFYYTMKTITFSNIDNLKPNGTLTKFLEILSFLLLGIFLLIIVVSLLFSLQRYKFKDLMERSSKSLEYENELLTAHIKQKYGSEINNEEDGFIEWIRKIGKQIF